MDGVHVVAVARDERVRVAGRVLVARVEAGQVRGAADHVHVHAVKPRGGELLLQLAHLRLELRRLAAHVPLALLRKRIERRAVDSAVAPHDRAFKPALGPARVVLVPEHPVRVDLQERAAVLHALHGRAERVLAVAWRPEERIGRVVGDVVPPVPVERDLEARLLHEPVDGRLGYRDVPPAPHPEVNLAQLREITRGGGFEPRLRLHPRAVHLRRLVPSAAIRRIDSGIRQRAGLARLFRNRRKPDVAQDERVRRGPGRHLERRSMEARVAALVEEVRDAPFLQCRHAVEHLEDHPQRTDALPSLHLRPVGPQDVAREARTEKRRLRRARNDDLREHDPPGILPAFISGVVEGRILESSVRTKRHLRRHREVLAAHGMPLPHCSDDVSVSCDGKRLHLSVRDDRGVDERAVRSDTTTRLRVLRWLPLSRFDREPHAHVAHLHKRRALRRS